MVAATSRNAAAQTNIAFSVLAAGIPRFSTAIHNPGEQGPGRRAFFDASEFTVYDITKSGWVNWSDALVDAGYMPNVLQTAIPVDTLLEHLANLTREVGRLPTSNHIRVASRQNSGFPVLTTFSKRLGSKDDWYRQLVEWCQNRPAYSDVAAMLSTVAPVAKRLPERRNEPLVSIPEDLLSNSYLPPVVASLPALAAGSEAVVERCRALQRSQNSEFERRVGVAFSILGFQLEELGQGRGAVADGIAKCVERQWAVIYDAKIRGSGYRLLTEDRRKFRDYISVHERTLSGQGIRRLYFAVVSSGFSERDLDRAREVKRGTDARSCILIEASALVALVERKVREPLRSWIDEMERIFEDTRILTAADVAR